MSNCYNCSMLLPRKFPMPDRCGRTGENITKDVINKDCKYHHEVDPSLAKK